MLRNKLYVQAAGVYPLVPRNNRSYYQLELVYNLKGSQEFLSETNIWCWKHFDRAGSPFYFHRLKDSHNSQHHNTNNQSVLKQDNQMPNICAGTYFCPMTRYLTQKETLQSRSLDKH